jgi:methylated-DNA-[protein]-cysteine S-methyltransferase/AraC family transcriptional regulator of adaptative response/methylated-DNA-[protein]-cysteine methyltransferase
MKTMTPEATLQLNRNAKAANVPADVLFYATGECVLGKVLVARSVKGVSAILLGDDRNDLSKVVRFAANPSERLDLALDMRGTPLQRRIWETIRAIPVGQTKSYMQVGRMINSAYPQVAARVVANACAANPLALVIPCHRVVRSDGTLAGYRWGLERKRELIEKEAVA